MKLSRTKLLFFDASCLVAAAGSSAGGSGFLWSLCQRGFMRAAVSQPILLEARRNVQENMGTVELERLYRILAETPVLIVPLPEAQAVQHCAALVGEKDAHVLAAAIAGGAPLLLCLDKPLQERVNVARVPLRALSPGEFIKELLPTHPDYPSMR